MGIGEGRVTKLTGWGKNSFVTEEKRFKKNLAKISTASDAKSITPHFPKQEAKAASEKSPRSSLCCLGWQHMLWVIPLTTSAQMLQLCPLPNSCKAPAYSLGRHSNREGLDAVWALVSSSQTPMHCQCVIIWSLFHNAIQTTMKKINSIPVQKKTFVLKVFLTWWLDLQLLKEDESGVYLNCPLYKPLRLKIAVS